MIWKPLSFSIFCMTLLLIIAAGCIESHDNSPTLEPVSANHWQDMNITLHTFVSIIDHEMDNITISVCNAARELDGVPIDDPSVNLTLLKLRRDVPFSFDVCRVDKNNTLVAITSELQNQWMIGTCQMTHQYTEEDFNTTNNECIITEFCTFQSGERGVMIIAPVYDLEGNFDGTLRLQLDVEYLFAGLVEYLRTEYGYTTWVVEKNGMKIYDEDTVEIGMNLTTNQLFQTNSTMNMVSNVLRNESGNTSYIFYTTGWSDHAQINIVWDTVYPGYGAEWRIIISDNVVQYTPEDRPQITSEELKNFVQKAYAYVQRVGKEEALAEFNDQNGDFINGELYIFAYDMNGTLLSLPYQPDLVGTNLWFMKDRSGVNPVQRAIARAEQGGGYVYYLYLNPSMDYVNEFKLSYVMAVDNDWFIGSGIYLHEVQFSHTYNLNMESGSSLISQVRNMQYLSTVENISSVVEMVEDPKSAVYIEGLYPFVLTENGTVLAYSRNPAIDDTNQLGKTNSYGMSGVREVISLAQAGGGMMYSLVWDSTTQRENYVLIYVEPADKSTYFGSMLILE